MKRLSVVWILIVLLASWGVAHGEFEGRPLPQFPEQDAGFWINSEPLTLDDLRGKVVFLDVWTFGCVNCVRSLPWVREVQRKYADQGLQLIGIHSPEFSYEEDVARVKEAIEHHELTFPNMLDSDHVYWKRLNNHYWPAVYLVDKQGRIRFLHIGETHSGTPRAREVEAAIEALLAE